MKIKIKWTDDCQGKKDYDGDIVFISSRYYPKDYQSNGKVSARSSVELSDGEEWHNGETEELVSNVFEGDSFEEVSLKVEKWSEIQINRIYSALRAEFQVKG